MTRVFPYPCGWQHVARRTCEKLDGQHPLCSDIWCVVETWTRLENSASPAERYDQNRLMAAAALIVNCSRIALVLFRGESVGSTDVQFGRDVDRLTVEIERCLGDIEPWVAGDLKQLVAEAAVQSVLELEVNQTDGDGSSI